MKKKRLTGIEILALLLVLLGAMFYFSYGPVEYEKDITIVAFGDSLTRGYGTPPGKNFVTFLSEYTGIPIINSGKSGDTTSDALIRLKEDVLDHDPDIVIVALGGNDYFVGNGTEVVRANLTTIIRRIKREGVKVILIGGGREFDPEYEFIFDRLAKEEGVDGYVPNLTNIFLFRKDLLFDDVHPNERGHQIIANRVLPVLESVLRQF